MKGKAPMPPKGGAATEADVKAAVEYVIGQMK
jgi:cytochrome c5